MTRSWLDIKYDKETYWNNFQIDISQPWEPITIDDKNLHRSSIIHDLKLYSQLLSNLDEKDCFGEAGGLLAEDIALMLSTRAQSETNPTGWITTESEPILDQIALLTSRVSSKESSTPEDWTKIIQLINQLD